MLPANEYYAQAYNICKKVTRTAQHREEFKLAQATHNLTKSLPSTRGIRWNIAHERRELSIYNRKAVTTMIDNSADDLLASDALLPVEWDALAALNELFEVLCRHHRCAQLTRSSPS
jgi:hypothetical protein